MGVMRYIVTHRWRVGMGGIPLGPDVLPSVETIPFIPSLSSSA